MVEPEGGSSQATVSKLDPFPDQSRDLIQPVHNRRFQLGTRLLGKELEILPAVGRGISSETHAPQPLRDSPEVVPNVCRLDPGGIVEEEVSSILRVDHLGKPAL
jgi:hypothetical protein